MYKILKYSWEQRHKHFWSSDWHNYHDPQWPVPIWKMRGYECAEDSAEKVLQKINDRVPKDGFLWFLGDGFLNTTDDAIFNWFKSINCQNIMYLMGNHESGMYRIYKQCVKDAFGFEDLEVYPINHKNLPNVTFLGNHQEIQIGKKRIIMNHFPLRIWNSSHRGSWHLSGHSHLNDPMRRPEYPNGKAIDMGWDYKNDVWSFDEIEDVMSTKTVELIDHHDKNTL